MPPKVAHLAMLILSMALIMKVQTSELQAIQLTRNNAAAVLDTVYYAHPAAGELIVAGVDEA